MGITAKYLIPYPESEDLVKDGASNMQEIAEQLEAELLAPALRLRCDNAATVDGGDRGDIVSYDTSSLTGVFLQRGSWTFEDDGSLLIPPTTGIYLVVASFLKPIDRDTATVKIETRVSGAALSTSIIWAQTLHVSPDDTDVVSLVTPAVVIVDAADVGFQIGVDADASTTGSGTVSIHRLSRV